MFLSFVCFPLGSFLLAKNWGPDLTLLAWPGFCFAIVVTTLEANSSYAVTSKVVLQEQCDQIWRNFKILLQFFEGLFTIWRNLELTLAKFLCNWANSHGWKWPKLKNKPAIWSHWTRGPIHVLTSF